MTDSWMNIIEINAQLINIISHDIQFLIKLYRTNKSFNNLLNDKNILCMLKEKHHLGKCNINNFRNFVREFHEYVNPPPKFDAFNQNGLPDNLLWNVKDKLLWLHKIDTIMSSKKCSTNRWVPGQLGFNIGDVGWTHDTINTIKCNIRTPNKILFEIINGYYNILDILDFLEQ
jgi:hypothetical protein